MIITGQELTLRAVTKKDAELLLEQPEKYAEQHGLTLPERWPHVHLNIHLPFYHELLQRDIRNQGYGPWVITIDTSIAGDITVQSIPNDKGEIWIGYYIEPGERNKGVASKAIKYLSNWAISQSDITRIYAECDHSNVSSVKALQNAGYLLHHRFKGLDVYSYS
ncbi:GNAT family N-acetyltransferase [Virgibacillus sp. MSP4-1]|uniref:GNAT family N-acetyltransferase n=1 Tax=Virgibacillus sp. MSP4-1 TaxID=2700081 RepID=UPI0003A27697|nr:GNAT family N-acetyltransferase [Virgibacillus sp. MSP4-1]QHS22134.1 GNAT family N-acetyltransferase [Virgibacillus sp. MSP4-1]